MYKELKKGLDGKLLRWLEDQMEYHCKVHKGSDGYWVECIELKGCFTQSD